MIINHRSVLKYDFLNKDGYSRLVGTENLNLNLENNKLSIVKYVINNSILDNTNDNNVLKQFMNYVNNMLLFYSLKGNKYFGYRIGVESISDAIVKKISYLNLMIF